MYIIDELFNRKDSISNFIDENGRATRDGFITFVLAGDRESREIKDVTPSTKLLTSPKDSTMNKKDS